MNSLKSQLKTLYLLKSTIGLLLLTLLVLLIFSVMNRSFSSNVTAKPESSGNGYGLCEDKSAP